MSNKKRNRTTFKSIHSLWCPQVIRDSITQTESGWAEGPNSLNIFQTVERCDIPSPLLMIDCGESVDLNSSFQHKADICFCVFRKTETWERPGLRGTPSTYGRPTVPKRLNLRACTDGKNVGHFLRLYTFWRLYTIIFYVCTRFDVCTRSFFTSVQVLTSVHVHFWPII